MSVGSKLNIRNGELYSKSLIAFGSYALFQFEKKKYVYFFFNLFSREKIVTVWRSWYPQHSTETIGMSQDVKSKQYIQTIVSKN